MCNECVVRQFEILTGTKNLEQDEDKTMNIIWDLLPSGKTIQTRLTAIGEVSFDTMRSIAQILGIK